MPDGSRPLRARRTVPRVARALQSSASAGKGELDCEDLDRNRAAGVRRIRRALRATMEKRVPRVRTGATVVPASECRHRSRGAPLIVRTLAALLLGVTPTAMATATTDAAAGGGTAIAGESASASGLPTAALLAGSVRGPWTMQAFQVPADARIPRRLLEGHLNLGAIRVGQMRVLGDRFGLAAADHGATATLPAVTLDLVSDGTALLPVRRGVIPGAHPAWDWVFEPGRAWRDAQDPTVTRAVLAFSVQERNANCLHNGMMAFAVDAIGRASDVAFQISSETCAYFQFDQWGLLRATFKTAALPMAATIRARRHRELAARMPVRPIAQLAIDHPGIDPARFGAASEVGPSAMTAYGVVVDGVHYAGNCPTRAGAHPDCDELALPSYSLAKSLVAGLALMRLERLYPGAAVLEVADLVPECDGSAWRGVTLRHLLDMSSGHYLSAADQADEDSADLLPFFDAEDHATRLSFACGHYPRREGPGQRWVYHTSDTYLLGTALARAYRRQAGEEADFYRDLLVRDLFEPLHLNPALAETRRTSDRTAQPFSGYGLTLHRDDVVRLAGLLQSAADVQGAGGLLDAALLREALQRDPTRPGLAAPGSGMRYQHGFWAWNAASAIGCDHDAWVPFMSGYGGIIVALFPNGVAYYYFSDGDEFRWAQAAREANRLRSFCEDVRP
jgi:CubicO group peptidase (beta-lactamase class C family)